MTRSIRDKVKSGETYRFVYTIDDGILEFYNNNLVGLVVESDIRNSSRELLFVNSMQSLLAGQTEIVLTVPANETSNWDEGSIVIMDIRIHNGSANGHRLSRTINIKVDESVTKYEIPLASQGSFDARDFSSDFRRATET